MKYTFDLHSIEEMKWARDVLDRRIKQMEEWEKGWIEEDYVNNEDRV